MLTLKETMDCIEAAEPDIADIYKSSSAIVISPEGLPRQHYEAFICTVKDRESKQIYVALASHYSKKALIYTAADEAAVLAGEEILLEEALAFVRDMGFEMEHVSLDYSPALRETVLRGIRVIRPVSTARVAAKKDPVTERGAAKDASRTKAEETSKAKAEKERKAAEEKRKAADEAARIKAEEERKAAEEAAHTKAEEERKAAEEAARIKAEEERKAAEEAAHTKAEEERKAAEEAAHTKAEEERKAAEEAARVKAEDERKAAEEVARIKAEEERKAAEEEARIKAEEERKATEEAARIKAEEERKAAEEEARDKAEEQRRIAELATEERQEAEKMMAEKAEAARLLEEKLEAERLAAEERISLLAEAEKSAAARNAEEKEAAEKAEAEKISSEANIAQLQEEERLAEERALVAGEALAKATAARMEAEQLFLQKQDEEQAAEKHAEQTRKAATKACNERIAAEEATEIIGQFEERARNRAVEAQKESQVAAAEQSAAKELLAAKTEELRRALEAAEAERLMFEKILEKKIIAEKAAHQAAGVEVIPLDAPLEEAAAIEEMQTPSDSGKRAGTIKTDRQAPEKEPVGEDLERQKAEIERLRGEKAKAEAEWKAAAEEAARLKAETDRLTALRLKAEEERLRLQAEEASAPESEAKKKAQDKGSGRKVTREEQLNVSVSSLGAWKRAAQTASNPIDYGGPPVVAGSDPFEFPGGDDGSFFGNQASTGGSGAAYTYNPAVTGIEYSSEKEIIELQESSNLARVALEGNPTQNCKGYICAVNQQDRCQVRVAIVLKDTDKMLVYDADRQPESADRCSELMGDAIQFLELIGFMMGTVNLGTDKAAREAAIAKIPVMHRLAEKA
jgi:hypothetical protein